eukprot:CAMPEP_0185778214 /NCGR_PEP_ID=MMETSP1174-20130828/91865_1 /TAXON_ID=35687 /ORGANISM="Dictyocha speculum, Strain CCMP1381" /LENGTH=747 /DNA_ID=CAMNT_0028466847 /DNA_START=43 /DNA_END=2289 /DNA_ORIENTATION=-
MESESVATDSPSNDNDAALSDAMMAAQHAAEAEVGDVTLKFEAEEPTETVAPKLLTLAAGGDSSLIKRNVSKASKTNQLDTLLAKASQYSEFIRSSQDQAAETFDATAQAALGSPSKGGKRKNGSRGTPSSSKKAKVSDSGEAAQKSETGLADAAKKMKNSRDAAPEAWQPENLTGGQLKPYQLEGLRWLTTLYENGLSGILADEMGLGKTIQVIALIAYLRTKGVKGPFIVAAPLATLPNWTREFKKWLPGVQTLLYHGSKAERVHLRSTRMQLAAAASAEFPVIITSYEICIIDRRFLERYHWQYLIVDEGQRVKNRNCRLIRELKSLNTQNRLLLSGTPIQNTLEELWSLLNFVNPAIFDSLEVFQSWFGFKNIGKDGTQEEDIVAKQVQDNIVTKLHEILRPFLLRRLKKDVLLDMPPKLEIVLYTPMSVLQRDYYDLTLKGELRESLLNMGLSGGRECSQINQNMNLRKICNHPFLFGEPSDDSGQPMCDAHPELLVSVSGKFKIMDRMLKKLKSNGHQVLIFSQMTELLNILEDYTNNMGWRTCRIDGSIKIQERQKQMDAFNNDPDIFIFMLSTRAGGLGINLQAADTVIIFDSDWNPHQDAQAQDRCHRIGQTRPVVVYRLLTIGSVEIDMMEKQISKKKLERMAITGGNFSRPGQRNKTKMSLESLKALLADDVSDLQGRADAEDLTNGISNEELSLVLDRPRLFELDGSEGIPPEGAFYDVLKVSDTEDGGILSSMS